MNYLDAIGIEYEFSNLSDIWKVFEFEGIDFLPYYFANIDDCIFASGIKRIILPENFKSDYLQALIDMDFVCVRLVLHLYPEGSSVEEIKTYEDFKQSNCELLLLMCDCWYLEIYAKNPLWIQKLYENAKQLPKVKVDLKYIETDGRTGMYV